MTVATFRLGEDNNSVVMEIAPAVAARLKVKAVEEAFRQSEFGGFFLNQTAVNEALACAVEQDKENADTAAGPLTAVVAERRDARLELEIARDGLSATGTVTAAYGGKHINNIDVAVAAREAGITTGLVMQKLADLVQRARDARPGEQVTEVIARGDPPVDGVDARLEKLAATLKDRILRPRQREDGSADMRDLGEIPAVQADQPLMRRHPPRPGKDGRDVCGRTIPHEPGKDLHLVAAEGSRIAADDPDLLVAERAGLPRSADDGMAVDPVLVLDTVDLSVGNVEFDGSVIIKGNVEEEMTVLAGGDVSIGGVVESAVVEAGGDLMIKGGVIGHKAAAGNYSVRLSAGGTLAATYAQNADLRSEGMIRIAKYLFHSRARARQGLWVGGAKRADGRLIGGDIAVGATIEAGIIGAEAGVKALLDLSLVVGEIQSELEQAEKRVQELTVLHNSLVGELKRLKPLGARQAPRRKRVAEMLSDCRSRLDQAMKIVPPLEQERDAALASVGVVARINLYPAIRIRLLDEVMVTSWEHKACRIFFKDGELRSEPIGA